jgi:hypothetical protein
MTFNKYDICRQSFKIATDEQLTVGVENYGLKGDSAAIFLVKFRPQLKSRIFL